MGGGARRRAGPARPRRGHARRRSLRGRNALAGRPTGFHRRDPRRARRGGIGSGDRGSGARRCRGPRTSGHNSIWPPLAERSWPPPNENAPSATSSTSSRRAPSSLRRVVEVQSASLEERQTALHTRRAELEAEADVVARDAAGAPRPRRRRRAQRPQSHAISAPSWSVGVARPRACARTTACGARRSMSAAPCSSSGWPRWKPGSRRRPDEEAAARARRSELERKQHAIDGDRRATRSERRRDDRRPRRAVAPPPSGAVGRGPCRQADGSTACGANASRSRAAADRAARAHRAARESRRPRSACGSSRRSNGIRHEFDCEPDVAIAAPAPEIPDGITASAPGARARTRAAAHGPGEPARADRVRSAGRAARVLAAATRRREEHAPRARTRHQGGRRGDRDRLRVGVRRRRRATSRSCSRCCSPAAAGDSCSPSRTTC